MTKEETLRKILELVHSNGLGGIIVLEDIDNRGQFYTHFCESAGYEVVLATMHVIENMIDETKINLN